jgi:hypothetical protein
MEGNVRLGYVGLHCDDSELPEADDLLEVVTARDEQDAKTLLDTGCITNVISDDYVTRNGIDRILVAKNLSTWLYLVPSRHNLRIAPPNEDRRLQDEWTNLRQHGSVFEYVSILATLAMQINGLSQPQILDKFIRGLKPKTHIEVELRDPQTTAEAYRLADHFDRIAYGAQNTTFLTQRSPYNQSNRVQRSIDLTDLNRSEDLTSSNNHYYH